MPVESVLALFVAMLISAAVPGPGVFACIARAIASGFRDTLYVIGGILVGNIAFLCVVVFGLAAAAQTLGSFFVVIRYLGALYLIWLGIKLWFSPPSEFSEPGSSPTHVSNFLTGLVVPFSNSSVIFFYVSLLPTFINLKQLNLISGLITISVISIALFVVLAAYSYSAARARKIFRSRKTMRRFNRGAGALMIGTGVYTATR